MIKFISKLEEFNLDKQIEKRAIKWILNSTKEEDRLYAKNFLKDKNNLKETVKEYAKANGCEIVNMVRYEVGEGIEKKQENFAEEVMSQING